MNEKKYKIILPPEVIKNLDPENELDMLVSVEDQTIMMRPTKRKVEKQTVSLRWFLIPAIVASIIFNLVFFFRKENQIPFTGEWSVSSLVLVLGVFSGICSFVIFFALGKSKRFKAFDAGVYWRNFPTLLLAFTITLLAILLVFFWMISVVFEGVTFDRATATMIFFLFAAIVNYLMIYATLSLSPSWITHLLIFVIVGGVMLSMLTNGRHQWWQYNFSFLGTKDASSSWQFNLTLVFSALLLLTLIDFLFVSLEGTFPKNKQLIVLRILLTLTAIDLGAIGSLPNNGTGLLHTLHDKAANYLVYLILILILGVKWLLPKVSREFLITSYLIGLTLFVANLLFQNVGYLSITAFELIAFFLAFSWLLLLLQNIERLMETSTVQYAAKIEMDD